MSAKDLEKLRTLKLSLKEGVVSDTLMIFEYEDNPFLVNEYLQEIIRIRGLDIEYYTKEDNLNKILRNRNGSIFGVETKLIVYICDKFDIDLSSDTKDVIVICKECNAITDLDCIYKFPKLEDWQVIAYIKSHCKGLDDDECRWLYDNIKNKYKNNEGIYRVANEVSKISCFDEKEQSKVFNEISSSSGYSDLSQYNIFNLTNAIIKRDKLSLLKVLNDIESIDVDAYGLMTILHKSFKQVIDVQLGKNATAQTLGVSDKQFNAIKYNCGKYSAQELIDRFKFLTNIDYKLKSGLLDIDSSNLIDYIITCII